MTKHNYFSGIWHSKYEYPSSSREGRFVGEHYVKAFQRNHGLVFESVREAEENKSYLVVKLTIDDTENVATGTWQETTDPEGHYKGSTYHGSIQLIIDEDKQAMRGKWLGFGKNRDINTGPWEFTYVGETLPES
jgi:hypothetical protein